MPAASVGTEGFGQGLVHHQKLTKSRNRTVVKPILKKFHSAGSDNNSLDLDRGWDEQGINYHDQPADDISPGRLSARDVTFSSSASHTASGNTLADTSSRRRHGLADKYTHARSTSGASHASIATSGSGRTGTFVHPFQQTPRTSEPPLSQTYSNTSHSRPSLDLNYGLGLRDLDHSSTITEDQDDVHSYPFTSVTATPTAITPTTSTPGGTISNNSADDRLAKNGKLQNERHNKSSSYGRTVRSLAGQRTNSLSDVTSLATAPRSATSNRSHQASTPRIPAVLNHSRPELYSSSFSSGNESSPLSSTVPALYKEPSSNSPHTLATACSSITGGTPVVSPLRSSLDMGGFRLRSRSSLDTATRQEQVRQARRKFEEKEKAKEEKYARAETKKRERADTKEAQRQLRKGSFSGLASGRTSSSTEIQPTASRKNTGTTGIIGEKDGDPFGQGYDSVQTGERPQAKAEEVVFTPAPRRSKTAKRKTTGAWTSFVLWLRTRLLKLGRR
ncbi:hypothetical protein NLU13_1496 [Sarocladium strictum]|uniref:Uncharacterized protein n=1 Tax=Sarocladium strictum TaxID=5046 RepID=A0AA39LCA4_SARSR|nr:hypothetical protein NLU13_1496 [Sarocladium strictum]